MEHSQLAKTAPLMKIVDEGSLTQFSGVYDTQTIFLASQEKFHYSGSISVKAFKVTKLTRPRMAQPNLPSSPQNLS